MKVARVALPMESCKPCKPCGTTILSIPLNFRYTNNDARAGDDSSMDLRCRAQDQRSWRLRCSRSLAPTVDELPFIEVSGAAVNASILGAAIWTAIAIR